jgi:hypothetical protein
VVEYQQGFEESSGGEGESGLGVNRPLTLTTLFLCIIPVVFETSSIKGGVVRKSHCWRKAWTR